MENEKMVTLSVNYGTINGMKVELPTSGYNCAELLSAWIKGFIKHMTNNAIVSDDVLISSIGTRFAKEALMLGIKERVTDNPRARDAFLSYVTDDNWRFEVIKQRRGRRAAMVDRFGEEMTSRIEAIEGKIVG